MKKLSYAQVGDNYDTKDPIKLLAQNAASETAKNLLEYGFSEISQTRGESAYVWKQGDIWMASVIEQLGTKNLIADDMRKATGKTYYDVIAHDAVATVINDLVTVGASPLVMHAYWAIENNTWLADTKRMKDLIRGWKSACDLAGVSWGGGETPTLQGIMKQHTATFGGSAVGIITEKKRLLIDENIQEGDCIILLQSSGINANGLSLARAIAKKLPKGYKTVVIKNHMYGEVLLTKTHIYAKLIQKLFAKGIALHYLTNITGHGFRKLMRARQQYTYVVEKILPPLPIFTFIQEKANLSDYDMYGEFNMGMDYGLFVSKKDVVKAQKIIQDEGFKSIVAGYVKKGEKQVVIVPKNITFTSQTLHLR